MPIAMATPPTPSVASELLSLVPVIVGGVIAITGGLVGSFASHVLEQRREKNRNKREQLLRVVAAAYDLTLWTKKNDNYYLWGREEVLEQPPMATIMAITRLYWRELAPEAHKLDFTVDEYLKWLMEGAELRLAANPPLVPKAHRDKVGDVWKPFLIARAALLTKVETLAKQFD
jgi:hypothetical protein